MKVGIVISIVIVAAFLGFGYYLWHGTPVAQTAASSPAALEAVAMPKGLPAMFVSAEPDVTANNRYREVLRYYFSNESSLSGSNPDPEKLDELADLYISAMNGGRMDGEFLDDAFPIKLGYGPSADDPLVRTPSLILAHALSVFNSGDNERGLLIAQAVWSLGERLLRHSVRLHNRRLGLEIMRGALPVFAEMSVMMEDAESKLEAWDDYLADVDDTWANKQRNVLNANNFAVADMIAIAQNDKDRTFRVEATLRLGIAKFKLTGRGDERAVQDAIDEAKESDDAMIREAAESADALTLEDFKKL